MELSEKLHQAKQSVSSYTSAIESMKAQRDTTLSDIERFQLGLDVGFATLLPIWEYVFTIIGWGMLSEMLFPSTYYCITRSPFDVIACQTWWVAANHWKLNTQCDASNITWMYKNILDCTQSNLYSSCKKTCIIFSSILAWTAPQVWTFEIFRAAADAILNLVQPEVALFNPPTPKTMS